MGCTGETSLIQPTIQSTHEDVKVACAAKACPSIPSTARQQYDFIKNLQQAGYGTTPLRGALKQPLSKQHTKPHQTAQHHTTPPASQFCGSAQPRAVAAPRRDTRERFREFCAGFYREKNSPRTADSTPVLEAWWQPLSTTVGRTYLCVRAGVARVPLAAVESVLHGQISHDLDGFP